MHWAIFLPGSILAVMGVVGLIAPARRPTWWRGYRSRRSMRSQQAWDEANRLAAQLLLLAGILSLNTALTCWFLSKEQGTAIGIVLLVSCSLLVLTVVITEIDLERNFDRDGNRRA